MITEYEQFYNPQHDKNARGCVLTKNRNAFERIVKLLEKDGGELLSSYVNSKVPIKIKIFGLTFVTDISHLERNIDNLKTALKRLKENNDTFISFHQEEKDSKKIFTMTFQNNNDKSINTIAINAYTQYTKGRKRFYDKLKENGHTVLTPYISNDGKVLIDYHCGHKPTEVIVNSYVSQDQRCPICSNHIIVPYVNDFYTLHKDLLIYFENPSETIGVTSHESSNKKYHLICPDCKKGDRWMTLKNIVRNGFSCPYCSNKISYFNRFMGFLLTELNEDYETEKCFDWCRFKSYDGESIRKGIYDFVIEKKKLIIELDGGFHFSRNNINNQSIEETRYIDNMKDQMAIKNGYKIIRINCTYNAKTDRFIKFVKNLKNGEFSLYYNIDNIDLNEINKKSAENDMKIIVEYWNNNYSFDEVVKETNYCKATVRAYLNMANEIGLCKYNQHEGRSRSRGTRLKVLQEDKLVGVFNSITDASKILKNKYHIPFDKGMIRKNMNGITSSYKNLNFIQIDNDEYRELLQQKIYDIDMTKIKSYNYVYNN